MPEHITGAVNAGAFAIPDRKHPVPGPFPMQINLLRAPDSGGRQIFVQARMKGHAGSRQSRFSLAELQVNPAQRRTAITGHIARRVQPRRTILFRLQKA